MLAKDAVLLSDGGGKRKAALRPIVGPEDIVRLLQGLAWRAGWAEGMQIRPVRINGYPGVVAIQGEEPMTIAFQPGPDGKIAGVYLVRNPDKLGHVAP